MKKRISECCKKLRLSQNIAENYESIEADSHHEYLLKVLEHEAEYRDVTRVNRLINQAKFNTLKTFDDYIFDNIKIPSEISINDLKTASFIEDKKNLVLYGNVGTGKSHMATAIGIEACKRSKKVLFFRTASLVNQLNQAKKKDMLGKLFKKIDKAELIICDEWGYVPLDRDGSQLLFQVISDCYEKKSVIITTNLEFSKWVNIFYDEQMTAAMIDRIVHHSHLLIFDGESYRIKNSLMKGDESKI
ncbi:MAG: IS21-like element helper ATPase IstB [Halanaerobium sp.]